MMMIELYATALDEADRAVSAHGDDDLARPSGCEGWSIGRLLAHMSGQNHGFAEAIRTGNADRSAYAEASPEEWSASIAELRAAVADPADRITLVEIAPDRPFDLDTVLRIHTLDTVVHTWDVAGRGYRPSDDLIDAVASTAPMVPADGRDDRSTFAPVIEADPGDDEWARTLHYLGRRP